MSDDHCPYCGADLTAGRRNPDRHIRVCRTSHTTAFDAPPRPSDDPRECPMCGETYTEYLAHLDDCDAE